MTVPLYVPDSSTDGLITSLTRRVNLLEKSEISGTENQVTVAKRITRNGWLTTIGLAGNVIVSNEGIPSISTETTNDTIGPGTSLGSMSWMSNGSTNAKIECVAEEVYTQAHKGASMIVSVIPRFTSAPLPVAWFSVGNRSVYNQLEIFTVTIQPTVSKAYFDNGGALWIDNALITVNQYDGFTDTFFVGQAANGTMLNPTPTGLGTPLTGLIGGGWANNVLNGQPYWTRQSTYFVARAAEPGGFTAERTGARWEEWIVPIGGADVQWVTDMGGGCYDPLLGIKPAYKQFRGMLVEQQAASYISGFYPTKPEAINFAPIWPSLPGCYIGYGRRANWTSLVSSFGTDGGVEFVPLTGTATFGPPILQIPFAPASAISTSKRIDSPCAVQTKQTTVTLSPSSQGTIVLQGTLTPCNVLLPVTNLLMIGTTFTIVNNGTGVVNVYADAAGTQLVLTTNTIGRVSTTCVSVTGSQSATEWTAG